MLHGRFQSDETPSPPTPLPLSDGRGENAVSAPRLRGEERMVSAPRLGAIRHPVIASQAALIHVDVPEKQARDQQLCNAQRRQQRPPLAGSFLLAATS